MAGEGGGVVATVKSLFVYPIKSCRGISLRQAPLSSTGFRWDRQWLVVNSSGRAYTQRVEPKLALVEVELPNEAFAADWEPNKHSYLVIKAPCMDVLKVPLTKSAKAVEGISVWEWSGTAVDEGAAAVQWFSSYLGKPSRLVRFDDASEVRTVDPNYAHGYRVMFSDQYPFLLLSQGSLNALNALLKEPVPVNRFRPNILVDGCEPFSEDLWTEIRIDKSTFQGVKLCSRCKVKANIIPSTLWRYHACRSYCVTLYPDHGRENWSQFQIPTINQETAMAGSEPTKTLMSFRTDEVLRPNKKKQQGRVYFGQNMVCIDSLRQGKGKSIKVGDPVFVLKVVSSTADAAA